MFLPLSDRAVGDNDLRAVGLCCAKPCSMAPKSGRVQCLYASTFSSLCFSSERRTILNSSCDSLDDLPHTSLIAAYYLMASTFYTIIWSARLSILFSIIRLDPDAHIRRRLFFVAGLFIAALLFFLAQLLWTCQPDGDGWMGERSPQCMLGKTVAICQLICTSHLHFPPSQS